MTDEKRHIYIDADLADKIEQLQDAQKINAVIEKHFDASMADVKDKVYALDHFVLEYRGIMAKAQRKFLEASDAAILKSEEVWEAFEDKKISTTKKIDEIKESLEPVTDELDKIDKMITGIDIFRLERVLVLLVDIMNVDKKTNEIFKFLIENYSEDQKK